MALRWLLCASVLWIQGCAQEFDRTVVVTLEGQRRAVRIRHLLLGTNGEEFDHLANTLECLEQRAEIDVNDQGSTGNTPLAVAVYLRSLLDCSNPVGTGDQLVKYLLEKGADVNMRECNFGINKSHVIETIACHYVREFIDFRYAYLEASLRRLSLVLAYGAQIRPHCQQGIQQTFERIKPWVGLCSKYTYNPNREAHPRIEETALSDHGITLEESQLARLEYWTRAVRLLLRQKQHKALDPHFVAYAAEVGVHPLLLRELRERL